MYGDFLHSTDRMSDTVSTTTQGQGQNVPNSCGLTPNTPPSLEYAQKGQSVEYAISYSKPDLTPHWFAVRATQGRSQKVYDELVNLQDSSIEPYLPLKKDVVVDLSNAKSPRKTLQVKPLMPSFLFLRCTIGKFRQISQSYIPGFSPYYDHCSITADGKNEYLTIPDKQFESFRHIIESYWDDIIVDQSMAPQFLVGDRVRVIEGPYAGIEGIVMKYKHQRRVFVQLEGIGNFGTGYIAKAFLEKIQ